MRVTLKTGVFLGPEIGDGEAGRSYDLSLSLATELLLQNRASVTPEGEEEAVAPAGASSPKKTTRVK